MLHLGYVPIALGDMLILTFHNKNEDDQLIPFSNFEFKVDTTGLIQLLSGYSPQTPTTLNLRTWEANTIVLPINFRKNNTYIKKHQNTIASALQENNSDVLLENVTIELEVRQSDFINLASKKGHLESATVGIRFDRESLIDLIMARDISEHA